MTTSAKTLLGVTVVIAATTLGPAPAAQAGPSAAPITAPPLSAITAPITTAPRWTPTQHADAARAWSQGESYALGDMTTLVVLSCKPSPDRSAWRVPVTVRRAPAGWIYSSYGVVERMPVVDGAQVDGGWPIELVAYGTDASTPIARSGCLRPPRWLGVDGPWSVYQDLPDWGQPAAIGPDLGGNSVGDPSTLAPEGDGSLAVLPGQAASEHPAQPLAMTQPPPVTRATSTHGPEAPDEETGPLQGAGNGLDKAINKGVATLEHLAEAVGVGILALVLLVGLLRRRRQARRARETAALFTMLAGGGGAGRSDAFDPDE